MDKHGSVLRSRSDVHPGQSNVRRPSDIPNPVFMTFDSLLFGPFFLLFIKSPDSDEIVRTGGNKSLLRSKRVGWLLGAANARSGREDAGSPGDGVGTSAVGREDVDLYRSIVLEAENGDLAIARSTSKNRSQVIRSPSDRVYARGMQCVLLDSLPTVLQLSTTSLALSLSNFLPDENPPIVRTRSKY